MTGQPATTSAADGAANRLDVTIGVFAAAVIAVFSFLPIVDFLPGGRTAQWYPSTLAVWLNGSLIALGSGVLYAIATRRYPGLWRNAALRNFTASSSQWMFAWVAAAIALTAYVLVAVFIFDRKPLLIDEIVQLLQARIFSEGQLFRATSATPGFFSTLHVIDSGDRYFSQFPAGGPAMYLPGWLLGIPWLTNPVCGALSVVAFARWVQRVEPRPAVVAGATLVFALSPFMVFMSGSHMNHVPALMWTMIAMLALAIIMNSTVALPRWAFVLGIALGLAGTIRPVDALAFALPAGFWLFTRAIRTRRLSEILAAGGGMTIPLGLLLWINTRTTGSPLLFGYELLWGASHGLGFHVAPWGFSHTPARGLELVNLYFLRLQNYLFESPVPSLVPVIGALALIRRLTAWDRYLLVSTGLVVVLYFAYWHDGFYLGPRFLFPLLPALALWTARFPAVIRERWGGGSSYRAVWGTIAVSVVLALAVSVPIRARQYANGLMTMR